MTATQAGQPAKEPDDDGPFPADVSALPAAGGTAERIAVLRARLLTPMPGDRLWGWIAPLLVTVFAGWLRFNRLSVPNSVDFDETYYAKDAWSILKHGEVTMRSAFSRWPAFRSASPRMPRPGLPRPSPPRT